MIASSCAARRRHAPRRLLVGVIPRCNDGGDSTDPTPRRLPALLAALSLLASPMSAHAQVPTGVALEASGPLVSEAPMMVAPAAPPAEIRGPTVHIVVKNEDPNKGPVKLARYRGARPVVTSGDKVVIPTYFDELCTEPCGVAVDVSERPMFFFVRDGTPVSNFFRLNNLDGHITVRVRTTRRGLLMAGAMTLMFLVGIPMVIAAAPRVWAAKGRPGPDLRFKRLRRARF